MTKGIRAEAGLPRGWRRHLTFPVSLTRDAEKDQLPDIAVLPTPVRVLGDPVPFACMRSDAGTAARLTLAGDLDLVSAPRLEAALVDAATRFALVIVDGRGLEFVDCSGLQVLLRATRAMRDAGGRLIVVRGAAVEHIVGLARVSDELELVRLAPSSPAQEPA